MKIVSVLIVAAASALLNGCDLPTASAAPNRPDQNKSALGSGPIVVELFQSQGCSSCPPANAALNAIAERNDIIALSFAVTYWDRLGWKDTFADPAYTKRQYAYAGAMGSNGVYTPQIVLNGRRAIVGNKPGELAQAVAATHALANGPSISAKDDMVTIGAGKGQGEVLLVRYDPRTHQVAIRSGENGGRKLPHRNIVRQLIRLGNWDGRSVGYRLPKKPDPAWQSAVLVQTGRTGPIAAARRL